MANSKGRKASSKTVREDFQTLDNLTTINRYFKLVARMDKANLSSKTPPIEKILKLWNAKGQLRISGPSPMGEHAFTGNRSLAGFYEKRVQGIPETFRRMVLNMEGAKSVRKCENRAVANGVRHLLTTEGEGLAVPFSHDFTFDDDGLISSLSIHIGKPASSPIAPKGSLGIKDMGKLAAVAWMVA